MQGVAENVGAGTWPATAGVLVYSQKLFPVVLLRLLNSLLFCLNL